MANNFQKIRNGLFFPGLTSDPSSARAGDFYYNSTSGKFRFYDGAAWADIGTGGGGGGGAVTISVTAGENIAANDALYISVGAADGGRTSGRAYRLDATNNNRIEFIGFAIALANSGSTVTIQVSGSLTGFSGLDVGKQVFASVSAPGATQNSPPTTAGQWIVPVGIATAATDLNINEAGSATAVKITSEIDPFVYASIVTVSTDTTLTAGNTLVLVNASGAPRTITLPAPTAGKIVHIKKIDSSANAVTISAPSGTIDGAANKVLAAQYDSVIIASDGTNFSIVSDAAASSASAGLAFNVTAGESLSVNDAVYISVGAADGGRTAGRAYKVDATNDNRVEFVGFALDAVLAGATTRVQVGGSLTGLSGFTTGKQVFASVTTPGGTQNSSPSAAGQWIIPLGVATSASALTVNAAGSSTAVKITSGADPFVYASTVTVSTNTVLTTGNTVVLVNAAGGNRTITLPAPTAGKILHIKKIDSSLNTVSIVPASGTIEGASSKILYTQYDSVIIVSDGTNFSITSDFSAVSVNLIFNAIAGESIAVGDALYISVGAADGGRTAGSVYKINATNNSRVEFIGIALDAATATNSLRVQAAGELSGYTGLPVGQQVFASVTTPGSWQSAVPNINGQWIIPIGIAKSSTNLIINSAGSSTAILITGAGNGVYVNVNTYTTNTTLTNANDVVLVNAASGAATMTLPVPSAGKAITVKKIDSSVNLVNIIPAGSETIDGMNNRSLLSRNDSIDVVTDGTNWYIV